MTNISAEFSDWTNLEIIYKPYVGKNAYNESTYGASENIECYIEGDIRQITNFENKEVISSEQVYLLDDAIPENLSVNDYIELDSRHRPIQKIRKFYNEHGNLDYVMVFL